jgi:nitrite reductase (NADH) large subunit
MSAQLDEGGGQALGRLIVAQGIELHLGTRARTILCDDSDAVTGLQLGNGREIAADMVVYAIGISARDELARDAGLTVGTRGGVTIGNDCRTSDANIWAIGEVASWNDRCVGLVAPANAMARSSPTDCSAAAPSSRPSTTPPSSSSPASTSPVSATP